MTFNTAADIQQPMTTVALDPSLIVIGALVTAAAWLVIVVGCAIMLRRARRYS